MPCTDCPLHTSALFSNCLPGRGPDDARVMLVGQGPGGTEDVEGRPFVGRSGKLLDAMLLDAGYELDELFFTNATRCRPPMVGKAERAPTPAEVDACRKYLIEEVHRVKPEVIVALGDIALRALCKTSGIKRKRGQEMPLHGDFGFSDCSVWPTYHPAAVLRVPTLRRTVTADLRKVRDRTLEQEKIDWRWSPGPIELCNEYIAYDIETFNAQGAITDKPTQIAFADSTDRAYVGLYDGLVVRSTGAYVSHFGWDFDDAKTGIQSDRDTAALAYLDDETQPLGLESLCVKYLGVRGWKEARDGAVLGSDTLAEYNARDALYTLRLHDHLVEALGPRLRIADRILLPGRLALNECSRRGIYIDGEEVERARVKFEREREQARLRCKGYASNPDEFNPGSNQQVAAVLIGRNHPLPTTATGEWATDKGVLQALDDSFADAVIDYREAVKTISTYVTPYAAAAKSDDGRMHAEYTIIRTVTGRTSARRSNVQNLDRELRGFFSAPPGESLVSADYSSIEFRLAAWCAQEPTILAKYAADPNWDPHRYFASLFYDKPEYDVGNFGPNSERQIAKSANFSQLFLGTEDTLIDYGAKMGAHITRNTARAAHIAFRHTAYPGFKGWWQSVLDELREHSYVESATGRRRHFGDWSLLNGHRRSEALREAVNFKVQSLAADIALLGLAACHREGLPINGFFHDAISFHFLPVPVGEAVAHLESIRRCMVEEPVKILREEFGVNVDVPLTIEIKTVTKNQTKKRATHE